MRAPCFAEGVEFVESANGVILSPGVEGVLHPKYFARVVDAKTGQSLLYTRDMFLSSRAIRYHHLGLQLAFFCGRGEVAARR